MKQVIYTLVAVVTLGALVSCEDFLNPNQDLILKESDIPQDMVELRSMSLGLYAIQQELVDQIVILGELRGDLLDVTESANSDLRDISYFNINPGNQYADPSNFYRLIAASNKVIRILEEKYIANVDSAQGVTDYHKMHGEALCMRSWAYFNAARIYNEIPYIPETMSEFDKIVDFINTPGEYVDSSYIEYAPNGLDNDTIVKVYEAKDKMYLERDAIVRKCISDIENRYVASGVDYGRESDDDTWMVTVWNEYAQYTLLGHMYMHIGDYAQAMDNFNNILEYPVEENSDIMYGLDDRFAGGSWRNILVGIDKFEHIYTLWFGKSSKTFQKNNLQYYFSSLSPNIHAMQPTKYAVELWETLWYRYDIVMNSSDPSKTYMRDPGTPGDFSRGNFSSFAYIKQDGSVMSLEEWAYMMELKQADKTNELRNLMEGVDTVVYKYTLGKNRFSYDANFMLYRAAAVHLYAAEIFTHWEFKYGSNVKNYLFKVEDYIFDGSYKDNTDQLGVAGRVGFDKNIGFSIDENVYVVNPYTNEVVGYQEINTTLDKILYLEDVILRERARELAYEGERYYDILRMAERRNKRGLDGNAFLAETISKKFKGSDRDMIYNKLLDENNWYIPFQLN